METEHQALMKFHTWTLVSCNLTLNLLATNEYSRLNSILGLKQDLQRKTPIRHQELIILRLSIQSSKMQLLESSSAWLFMSIGATDKLGLGSLKWLQFNGVQQLKFIFIFVCFRKDVAGTVLVLVYMDDIVLAGNNWYLIKEFISALHRQFSFKNLGDLHYFLGKKVTRTISTFHLCHTKYLQHWLSRINMDNCKEYLIPSSICHKLTKYEGKAFPDDILYRSVVGALQYATFIRLESAFAVNKLSQFMAASSFRHWQVCKRVL